MAPPKGKGKDLSRMSAPPTPAPAPATPALSSSSSAVGCSHHRQSHDFPSPRGNKPKGKDFGRMQPPAPVAAAVAVAQSLPGVPSEPTNGRTAFVQSQTPAITMQNSMTAVQNSRLVAFPPPYAQPPHLTQQQSQHQILVPNSNAPPHLKQKQRALSAQAQKKAQQKQKQKQALIVPQINASTNRVAVKPITNAPIVSQTSKRPTCSEASLSTTEHSNDKPTTTPSSAQKSPDGHGKLFLAPILGEKLHTLCHSIDPSYTLDSEVQERLVEMADSFVDKVTKDAIKLARHRGSTTLDVVDMALALNKGYNIEVPGLGPLSVASGTKGGQVIGGWLFADRGALSKKKRKANGTTTVM